MPRFLLRCLLTAGILLTAAAPAQAEFARPADEFAHSIGVNTHIIYGNTYGRFDIVKSRLQELGVKHIRDSICGTCNWQWDRYAQLNQSAGIQVNAIVGNPADSATVFNGNIAAIKRLGPTVDMVEGANEWDWFSGRSATWTTDVRAHQQRIWNAMQADPALRVKPVVGPSLVFSWERPSSWDKLGDMTPSISYTNSHGYPGGRPPEAVVDSELALAKKMSPTKPMLVTEAGYHNALQQTNQNHPAVPENVAAIYTSRMFLENFRKGVARTYAYELLDEGPGSATNLYNSFGLLRADYTPKPSFTAVKNLLTLLSDYGVAIAGAEVPLTVTSTATDLRRVLLRKRDGRVYLVLWRAGSLWNTSTRQPMSDATTPVTVQFGGAVGSVTAYNPVSSATGSGLPVKSGAVSVNVGSAPIVLEKR
jgi:hypothetical protein